MEKRKIYKASIEDQEGIVAVALVEEPAIESNFVMFSANEPEKLAKDEFKQVITGPLLIPDKLILRKDSLTDEIYYLKFDAETIEKLALRFMRNKFTDQTNEDHDALKSHNDIFLFESVLIKNDQMSESFEKLGLEKLPVGSWVGSFKVENKETFNRIVSGELRGFSIEAYLNRVLEDGNIAVDHDKMKADLDLINL